MKSRPIIDAHTHIGDIIAPRGGELIGKTLDHVLSGNAPRLYQVETH